MLGNKKESQKEEKPAGQVTKKWAPPPPISLAQGLDSLLDIVYTKLVR